MHTKEAAALQQLVSLLHHWDVSAFVTAECRSTCACCPTYRRMCSVEVQLLSLPLPLLPHLVPDSLRSTAVRQNFSLVATSRNSIPPLNGSAFWNCFTATVLLWREPLTTNCYCYCLRCYRSEGCCYTLSLAGTTGLPSTAMK